MRGLSFVRTAGVLLAAALVSGPAAAADTGELILKHALRSTAWIVVPIKNGLSMGSGSLIDAERRLVLTNYHVVRNVGDTCIVQFPIFENGNVVPEKEKYFEYIKQNRFSKGRCSSSTASGIWRFCNWTRFRSTSAR